MSYVRVGKIKDAHGIRGELFVVLFSGEALWLPKMTKLRLVPDAGGADQTFDVKSARVHKNGLIVKCSAIADRNHAETLKGLIVEVPEEFFATKSGESMYLREIHDFMLKNNGIEVGRIKKFGSNTVQDLLVVQTPKGEFEIPFVDAFVKKINYVSRTVEMELPHGLLGEDDAAAAEKDGQEDHLVEE